jgi:capsular polysaccharide transport system permease protein
MSQLMSTVANDFRDLRRGLAVQRRVMVALIIRQLMTKYGRHNIGFLWLVLEPMILCSGVLVVRSLIQSGEEYGVSLIALLFTGYMPLTLWRHLSSAGVFMLRRNGPMLYHRDITLLDCALATYVLELGGCSIALMIVYFALFSMHLLPAVYDWGILVSGWLLMSLLAASLMMIFAVLTEYYEAAERFIQPFQYLFLPICGFVYLIEWLPSYAQKLAWYVPTVHCYEMIRAGVLGPTVQTTYAPWYPVLWTILMLAFALPMVDKARDKIHFG